MPKRRSVPAGPVASTAKRRNQTGAAQAETADSPTDVKVAPPLPIGEWCRALQSSRDAKELIDITLLVEDRKIPAHRIVLAGFSPYIKGLLTSGLAESKGSSHELRISDADGGAVAAIVDCFYSGKLSISHASASSIIRTANLLGIGAVEKAACDFFIESLDSSTACEALNFAAAHEACGEHARELRERCARYVAEHFKECSVEPSFLELPSEVVAGVIGSDDVSVDEEAVLAAVRAWFDRDAAGRRAALLTLMPLVRWPLLPFDVQLQLSKEPLLKRLMQLDDQGCTVGMGLLLECSAGFAESEAAATCVRRKQRKGPMWLLRFTAFSQARYTTSEDGARLTFRAGSSCDLGSDLVALCRERVMSSGRSCAEFTVVKHDERLDDLLMIGVARRNLPPTTFLRHVWLVSASDGANWHHDEDQCFHYWQGCEEYGEGDVLRLLLDSNAGTLTVKKNGALLGVAVSGGLTGELCWAAMLRGERSASDDDGPSVRIKMVDPTNF